MVYAVCHWLTRHHTAHGCDNEVNTPGAITQDEEENNTGPENLPFTSSSLDS